MYLVSTAEASSSPEAPRRPAAPHTSPGSGREPQELACLAVHPLLRSRSSSPSTGTSSEASHGREEGAAGASAPLPPVVKERGGTTGLGQGPARRSPHRKLVFRKSLRSDISDAEVLQGDNKIFWDGGMTWSCLQPEPRGPGTGLSSEASSFTGGVSRPAAPHAGLGLQGVSLRNHSVWQFTHCFGSRSSSPSTWTSSEASSGREEGAEGASGASAPIVVISTIIE